MTEIRDQEIISKRGYPEITDDRELIEKAKELTNDWENRHGKGNYDLRTYQFDTFSFSEPYRSFTDAEFKRIKELQEIEKEKYNDMYDWTQFIGKPLSEDIIIRFLDKQIYKTERKWGPYSFYTEEARRIKEDTLTRWKQGELVEVDRMVGDYLEKILYSDGQVRDVVWRN